MAESAAIQPVVALIRDLMFVSKVSASARALDCPLALVRDPASLVKSPGRLLLVDLNLPGAIDAAIEWKNAHGSCAIGFVSHIDTPTIERARSAGIDRVMARSAFVAELESLLKPR